MDNQHKQIKGYRDFTKTELDLINEVKEMAERVGELVGKIAGTEGIDPRWAATAKTDLQKGFMSLVRSVAQPTTF